VTLISGMVHPVRFSRVSRQALLGENSSRIRQATACGKH
jgi:hypothetical protein